MSTVALQHCLRRGVSKTFYTQSEEKMFRYYCTAASLKSTLFCVPNPDRMWALHCLGNTVQVQPGCDGLERGVSGGQLHALVLPLVQAKAGEL